MNTETLNVEFLTKLGACKAGLDFIIKNNLETFPISKVSEIVGDYDNFKAWISEKVSNQFQYDSRGNLTQFEDSVGCCETWEYDSRNNKVRSENSNGYWRTYQYDSSGNLIRFEDSNGYRETFEYDSRDNKTRFENSRDYWKTYEYDSRDNLIRSEDSVGCCKTFEYDINGNDITEISSSFYDNGQLKSIGNMILPLI